MKKLQLFLFVIIALTSFACSSSNLSNRESYESNRPLWANELVTKIDIEKVCIPYGTSGTPDGSFHMSWKEKEFYHEYVECSKKELNVWLSFTKKPKIINLQNIGEKYYCYFVEKMEK